MTKKSKTDNEFLMKRIEVMHNENKGLKQKENDYFKDKDFDLDEQFGEDQSQQRIIEDLQDELRLVK